MNNNDNNNSDNNDTKSKNAPRIRTLLLKSKLRHQLSAIWAFLHPRTMIRLVAEHCPHFRAKDVARIVNAAATILTFVPLEKTSGEQTQFLENLDTDYFAGQITSRNRRARSEETAAARALLVNTTTSSATSAAAPPRIRTKLLGPKLERQLSAIWAFLHPRTIIRLVAEHCPHFRAKDVARIVNAATTILGFVPLEQTSGEQKKFLEKLDIGGFMARIPSCNRAARSEETAARREAAIKQE